MELTEKSCVPCRGGIPAMTKDQAEKMTSLTLGWELFEDAKKNTCNYLIIALQGDPTIERPNKCKPVQSRDRGHLLREKDCRDSSGRKRSRWSCN